MRPCGIKSLLAWVHQLRLYHRGTITYASRVPALQSCFQLQCFARETRGPPSPIPSSHFYSSFPPFTGTHNTILSPPSTWMSLAPKKTPCAFGCNPTENFPHTEEVNQESRSPDASRHPITPDSDFFINSSSLNWCLLCVRHSAKG